MACLLTFLALNELPLPYTTEQLFHWTLQVATGQLSREELAQLLKVGTDSERNKFRTP